MDTGGPSDAEIAAQKHFRNEILAAKKEFLPLVEETKDFFTVKIPLL